MTDWPDDWFRSGPGAGGNQPGNGPAPGPGAAGESATSPAAGGADPTVQLSHRSAGRDTASRGQAGAEPITSPNQRPPAQPGPAARLGGAGAAGAAGAAGGAWPAQPAPRTPGRPGRGAGRGTAGSYGSPGYGGTAYGGTPYGGSGDGGPGYGGAGIGWRRWLRPRRIVAILAVLLSVAVVGSVASYFYLDSKLTRKNILADYSGRPAPGSGQNWLITGSDSRQGLTKAQERKLATGHDISGRRSDTIMILHMPANGSRPVLISLPRDSYVPIPGHGSDKINAAYALGGPKLLAETVQNITGLHIDHYMGIGFGGFVHVVDAVGGVRMCLKAPLVDPAAGLHLHKGCQVLDGAEALGFVRSRHDFATQDLQRIQDQRLFLRALLRKLTSAGVLANPFAAFPAASGVAGTLTVDQGTHLYQLLRVAFALRNPITTTVPIAGSFVTSTGEDALQWNRSQALQLFRDLRTDHPIPRSLIGGSKLAG